MTDTTESTSRPGLGESDDALLQYLFTAYLALIPAGTMYLRYCGLESGTMTFDRALFWCANALTGTGFRLLPNSLAEFSTAGHWGVFALMLFGAIFALSAGGLVIARLLGLAWSARKIITAAIFFLAIGSLAGAGMLMAPGRSFFAALFEATSSLANAGMSLDGPRMFDDWRLYLIITPLAALGSLGLVVILQLFERFTTSTPLSEYTWRILCLSALAWLVCFAVLLLAQGELSRNAVLTSWLYAINARGLGAEVAVPFARHLWWILAGMMLVGGMPGSTTSGMRVTALATVTGQIRSDKPGRELGLAVAWIGAIVVAFAVTFVLLLAWRAQLGTDDAATLAAGAISNTGLFRVPVDLTGRSLHALAAAMVAGHLLPIVAAWWMLMSTRVRSVIM